jgi:peptidyl-tRNA hydrolase, PTH1 family
MIFKKISIHKPQDWFIFAGLGNPGREYENTRHNIGFLVIQRLAERWDIDVTRYKFQSLTGDGMAKDKRVALVMPQTYMNNSGFAVQSFVKFYKLDISHLMIIHDDLDLPFGTIRLRKSGGSAGQKGMQSIINQLGHSDFPRLRVGIGRPPGRMDAVKYVLKKFKAKDEILLNQVLDTCADAVEKYLDEGIEKAMTLFNQSILDNEK